MVDGAQSHQQLESRNLATNVVCLYRLNVTVYISLG